jgi:hypothetical protein
MTDEQPTPWVHGSDEDIIATVTHALRHEGRKVTRQADLLIARVAAERIVEALKRGYIVSPSIRRWVAIGDAGCRPGVPRRRRRSVGSAAASHDTAGVGRASGADRGLRCAPAGGAGWNGSRDRGRHDEGAGTQGRANIALKISHSMFRGAAPR